MINVQEVSDIVHIYKNTRTVTFDYLVVHLIVYTKDTHGACFRLLHVGSLSTLLGCEGKEGGSERKKQNQIVKMRLTAVTRNFNKLLDQKSLKTLDHFSQFNPSPLTIQQFMDFGRSATEEESFGFLKKELPVRLSNIMKEINLLPGNLLEMPSVLILQVGNDNGESRLITKTFQDWYSQSFRDLIAYERSEPSSETLLHFCQTLKSMQARHTNVVQTMAQVVFVFLL